MRSILVLLLVLQLPACGQEDVPGALAPPALEAAVPAAEPISAPAPDPGPDPVVIPLSPLSALPTPADCVELEECADIQRTPSKTGHPIVLAHGMGGFDEFGGLLEYWNGITHALREDGYAAYVSVVDPLNGSDVRAVQLGAFIDRVLHCTCADRVNVIAHSQGGIDARYLVNVLGYGDRVASITTVATPHRGTSVADFLLDLAPEELDGAINLIAWMVTEIYTDPEEETAFREALKWCSQSWLAEFAKAHPDDESVAWYSYAGRAGLTAQGVPECESAALPNPKQKSPISPFMLAGWTALGGLAGVDNDGLVTVESAAWGEFRGCLPADHMQEIGLGLPQTFDHVSFYRDHAAFLSTSGH